MGRNLSSILNNVAFDVQKISTHLSSLCSIRKNIKNHDVFLGFTQNPKFCNKQNNEQNKTWSWKAAIINKSFILL
jgi:hypothetical protein